MFQASSSRSMKSIAPEIPLNLIHPHTLLQGVIQGSTDIIFVKDQQGRYVLANAAAADWLNTSVASMMGQTDIALFPPAVAERIQQRDRQVMDSGELVAYEEEIEKDGEVRSLATMKYPWRDEQDQIIGVIGITRDVTDFKDGQHVERRLRESEERLQLGIQVAGLAIAKFNYDTHLVELSPEAAVLYGLPVDQLVVTRSRVHDTFHPDEREMLEGIIADVLNPSGAGWFAREHRVVWSNGEVRWLSVRKQVFFDRSGPTPRPDYAILAALDITDRKESEAALLQSELNFRILTDTLPQMFWATQPDGQTDYINKRWLEYTGLTLEETQMQTWAALLHPDDYQRAMDHWNHCLQTGNDFNIEYRLQRASDRHYRWFLAQAFPLRNAQGRIIRWFGSCTDIHDQKLISDERNQALLRERAAREQAEIANRVKDEFLAVLSHELRTPLNPILGWTKLLQSRVFDDATVDRALNTIERNANLQVQLIDDLLDLSRILRGKLTLTFIPVMLSEPIRAAIETVQLSADAKSIHIETHLEPSGKPVLGDPGRLQQVVWNLLTNAIKFTPEQGQVSVSLRQTEHEAQIQVTDSGKGINPSFLPHLFEAFRQEDSSTTRKFGGLGLGLAIVRQLVELHSGNVSAASAGEGQGATFTVTLPLIAVPAPHRPTLVAPVPSRNLQDVRVLIVDDDEDSLELLAFLLRQQGAIATPVTSASAALEALRQSTYDILISDIGMPDMNGYDLIRQLRTLPQNMGGRIPAIALTAYASEQDREYILSAGFQTHLAKPLNPERVYRAIADLLPSAL